MSIIIEQHAQNIDFETFTHLHDVCFPNEPVTKNAYQEFLSANFWAMYERDRFIGYSVMTIREQKAHIRRIGIHPDFRSRGFAKKLMEEMLETSKTRGINGIDLVVQQDNQPAIHVYRTYGFHVTGERIQFSVPMISMAVEHYSIIDIEEYTKSAAYFPHHQRMLDWGRYHNPPHRFMLIFLKKATLIGFTCFGPEFPGCSPFELFTENDVDPIQALISLLIPYALPNTSQIKITTENLNAITSFQSAGAEENYRLYEMTKTL